jgi:hypothetical protein
MTGSTDYLESREKIVRRSIDQSLQGCIAETGCDKGTARPLGKEVVPGKSCR